MKKRVSMTFALCLIFISCNGPETTVTNLVRTDGSVLRKVEMSNTKKEFNPKNFRVPVDSTWSLTDSVSVAADGDTTWYLLAEKLFRTCDAINETYLSDSGVNRAVIRTATFARKFRWFTTTYHFAEKCEKSMSHGYPYDDFLSNEEIGFMKLPSAAREEFLGGADSTRFKSLTDSMNVKLEKWYIRSLVSEWIEEAGALCASSGNDSLTSSILRSYENKFLELPDTLNFTEVISSVLGESTYKAFRPELDSAVINAERRFDRSLSFEEYTMRVVMPRQITASNGYSVSGTEVAWPVRGELFLSSDYVMEANSRVINYWMIVVNIVALFIIAAGTFRYYYRRKKLDN